MTDPFAIHNPSHAPSVHREKRRLLPRRGYTLDDYTLSEGQTPYIGVSAHRILFRIFLIALLMMFAIFFWRAASLQLRHGLYYEGVAFGNRVRIEKIPATRGLILDRNHVPLVTNVARFVLAIQPSEFPSSDVDRAAVTHLLAPYGITEENLRTTLTAYARAAEWVSIKEALTQTEAVDLTALVATMPGISVRTEMRRAYDTDTAPSLSHLLGYVGKPSPQDLKTNPNLEPTQMIGRNGLESVYETLLGGTNGHKQTEVDATGNVRRVLAEEPSVAGRGIVLGIDLGLQQYVESALSRAMFSAHKKRGAVIMMNPQNGEVMALVSLPSFNSNDFTNGFSAEAYQKLLDDPDHPLFPRATSGVYPSGSTIKPVFAAAALAEGVITPHTTVLSTGGIHVNQWFFPDWKTGGHGVVNVYDAIANSVNTFFYEIGGGYGDFKGLGPTRLAAWANRFGFGAPTGIDVPGEAAGFIPTPDWKARERSEPWYIGDTYHFAIGQGDELVTPLQLTNAIATIGNGGTRYAPHLIRATIDASNHETLFTPKITIDHFIDPQYLTVIRDAMRRTVTAGSAKSLQAVPVPVAGKTGTAQWNSRKSPHAWFTGFAPYPNPTVVITVLVEEGGEGSSIAVPIARDILTWYFNQRHS